MEQTMFLEIDVDYIDYGISLQRDESLCCKFSEVITRLFAVIQDGYLYDSIYV